MTSLCRDCFLVSEETPVDPRRHARCSACGSPRVVSHSELEGLSIAHIDCDAFYASVEKRDNPDLQDKPVIVGGGHRGVVSAACYLARMYGVGSAMPMFKALKACPNAVVIKPDMAKYSSVGREVRALMEAVTPLVEPISIDEAFLDLTGTTQLHGGCPARTLAQLVKRIETEIGVTASVGLSYSKFLAKIASDLDKPRGFAMIGEAEAPAFLAEKPINIIWGVGKAFRKQLINDGIRQVRDLLPYDEPQLVDRYGRIGSRLYYFARGIDDRKVEPHSVMKSISAETTFNEDIKDPARLEKQLWSLCEKVSKRLKAKSLAGGNITLKLKTSEFKQITRSRTLENPTQLSEVIYQESRRLLKTVADGRRFRLIGVGTSDLKDGETADPPSLLVPELAQVAKVERAIDAVRQKLGDDAIKKGRSLK
ncbi:DNA polymerase IV [Denitrobaculum tricleocarpae]|uniref:DNA polymerase IV n=1 Tax=Denitrobaculum tricleocarpae TaxID=2591009 RepID=A0A545TU11_9PROT|nr:DNA polymerase IV [Denitrobaculum tricleocarpae]TQV80651.1 DNA polymerase IV [Denitrobaculum tricleocarpae]